MFRCITIVSVLILLFLLPIQAFAAAIQSPKLKLITIDEAINLGMKIDAEVLSAKKNVSQKRIEWKQALQAVFSETEIDASLLTQPKSLSKDLNIRMKVPEARKSLIEAEENLIQQQRIATNKIRNIYIKVVSMNNNVFKSEQKLQASITKLMEVKTLVKLSKLKQADVEEAESVIKAAESELKQAKLSYKSVLLELSRAINRDVELGYTFELKPIYADLRADTIWQLISHATNNDTSLSSATKSRLLAEEKVNVTRQLYESKFGSTDMKIIQSMFNQEMNEELLDINYETFLERVKQQWEGYVHIIVPLRKSLFQGEYDGIRYFDDQRYSLPVSLFELSKTRSKEQDTLEQLLTAVKTSFLSVKTAEETYSQALQALDKVDRELSTAKTKLKIKQITQSQYMLIEDKLNEANQSVMSAWLSYYSAIYQLDLDTSGGLQAQIKQGVLPWKSIDDGLVPIQASPKAAQPLIGSFTIKPFVEPITSSVHIEVDPSIGATHYQLFTEDHIALSEKIAVGQPLIVIQQLAQTITDNQVVFFKQQQPVAEATFAGIGTSGSITIEKISSFDEKKSWTLPSNHLGTVIIGTFKVDLSQLTNDIASVALLTVAQSGQGIYYQPAGALEQWYDLQTTVDYTDIIAGSKASQVDKEKLQSLQLSVSVKSGGIIENLLSNDQLNNEINNVELSIEKQQILADEAEKNGQFEEYAKIMQEMNSSISKKAFLEALIVGNSGEIHKKLAQWSSDLSGEVSAPDHKTQADLAVEETNKLNEQLKIALIEGNSEEILTIATLYASALSVQWLEEQGVRQEIQTLTETLKKLETSYDEAKQSGDTDRLPVLLQAIETLKSDLAKSQKLQWFAEKQALELVIDRLSEQEQVRNELIKLRMESIMNIVEIEKSKYDEQELLRLDQATSMITELYGKDIKPLPVNHVISRPYEIKLDIPPVFADGQALIQIRPISETFGALVIWNETDQSVTITKNGIVINSRVGDQTAYVDGQPFTMEASPQLLLGRVVVPLRFIAVTLGIEVQWDSVTQTIEFSDKGDIQQ